MNLCLLYTVYQDASSSDLQAGPHIEIKENALLVDSSHHHSFIHSSVKRCLVLFRERQERFSSFTGPSTGPFQGHDHFCGLWTHRFTGYYRLFALLCCCPLATVWCPLGVSLGPVCFSLPSQFTCPDTTSSKLWVAGASLGNSGSPSVVWGLQ